jgi:hypothetical protein
MFALFFTGHLAHLVLTAPSGDYSGLARLMQVAAFPLLLVLPQRFPLHPVDQPAKKQQPVIQERRRFGAEPQIVRAYLDLSSETDPAKICQAITRTVAHTMLADLCLLVSPPYDNGQIILQCGHDLIRGGNLGCKPEHLLGPGDRIGLRRAFGRCVCQPAVLPDPQNLAQVLNTAAPPARLPILRRWGHCRDHSAQPPF